MLSVIFALYTFLLQINVNFFNSIFSGMLFKFTITYGSMPSKRNKFVLFFSAVADVLYTSPFIIPNLPNSLFKKI